MQSASLVGFCGVTFLLGVVGAGIAASLRTRRAAPAGVAIALFVANALFGYLRMSTPPSGSLHVALIESDDTVGRFRRTTSPQPSSHRTPMKRVNGEVWVKDGLI